MEKCGKERVYRELLNKEQLFWIKSMQKIPQINCNQSASLSILFAREGGRERDSPSTNIISNWNF